MEKKEEREEILCEEYKKACLKEMRDDLYDMIKNFLNSDISASYKEKIIHIIFELLTLDM